MRYTHTQVVEVDSPSDLRGLFRGLHRLLMLGPRSVKLRLAVQVERDVVFIRPGKGAVKIDFPAWVDGKLSEANDGGSK